MVLSYCNNASTYREHLINCDVFSRVYTGMLVYVLQAATWEAKMHVERVSGEARDARGASAISLTPDTTQCAAAFPFVSCNYCSSIQALLTTCLCDLVSFPCPCDRRKALSIWKCSSARFANAPRIRANIQSIQPGHCEVAKKPYLKEEERKGAICRTTDNRQAIRDLAAWWALRRNSSRQLLPHHQRTEVGTVTSQARVDMRLTYSC
jgi:hypothetical protein